jgi:hypothetical protein
MNMFASVLESMQNKKRPGLLFYLARFCLGIICVSILGGCQTISDNIQQSMNEKDLATFETIELLLLDYNFKKNKELLNEIQQKSDNISKTAALSKKYQAKVYGIQGEVEFYKGNMKAVSKYIELIESTYNSEERLFIMLALLAEDNTNKIDILKHGLQKAESTGLLKLYLARLYFQTNDFRSASLYFDDAFLSLNEKYKLYYQKERDLAYEFIKYPPGNLKINDILTLNILNVKHIIMLLHSETDFFAHLTPKKNIDAAELLIILKNAGYIYTQELQLDDICKRKDLAYLLLHIIAYIENDTSLFAFYSQQFQNQSLHIFGPSSPVPDVRINSYYFDAVLILVEREILALPDGINYFPENSLSGLDFAKIIKKLMQMSS